MPMARPGLPPDRASTTSLVTRPVTAPNIPNTAGAEEQRRGPAPGRLEGQAQDDPVDPQ